MNIIPEMVRAMDKNRTGKGIKGLRQGSGAGEQF